jgi:uncharacterized protein YndB with AHSA1/START domain
MTSLPFSLDRTVDIRARRATVFRFFTDGERFARWWGAGSTIDPVVGGAVKIVYPGGSTASGTVRELVADQRIAFTYGYDDPAKPIRPGGSLVTITLEELADGTRVQLRHDVHDAAVRDEHVQGWRYQLAVFAKVVAEDALAGAGDAIASWFTAWNAEPERARALLAQVATPAVTFRDAFGCVAGLDELVIHVAAVQRFMPGLRLEARGKLRHAHDTALVDWAAVRADGTSAMTGTNVMRFASDGRIADVVGVAG